MNWERSDRYDDWSGCRACVHYRRSRCVAYPERIPLLILSGEVDHLVPRPGQVGDTVFEPMDFQVWRETRRRVPLREEPAAPRT
jgi:hypothetical protein